MIVSFRVDLVITYLEDLELVLIAYSSELELSRAWDLT
jgi:hypothetical protein